MGPDSRKEETRRMEEAQVGRRKRALTREAVGSGLKEAIREMGLTEDVIRDKACQKGIVKGGGIRKKDKADVSIFRGIKLDSVPAWAEYSRGRGVMGARGGHGLRGAHGGHDNRGARGGQGLRGALARGRGRGGIDSRGRGSGGRGGRGGGRNRGGSGQPLLSGSNLSVIDAPDRKRKLTEEDKATEEAKKVKLMELASPTDQAAEAAASEPAATPPSSSSSSPLKKGGKSLIGILMSGKELDVARGFRLFD
jgi:hypothetical protein